MQGDEPLATLRAALLALLDGLAIAVAVEPGRMPPERAERAVSGWLTGVLRG